MSNQYETKKMYEKRMAFESAKFEFEEGIKSIDEAVRRVNFRLSPVVVRDEDVHVVIPSLFCHPRLDIRMPKIVNIKLKENEA